MLNRRSFVQGVISLAALGPLGRAAVARKRREHPLTPLEAVYGEGNVPKPYSIPHFINEVWTPDWEEAKRAPQPRPGPTVLRAHVLFGEWADLP